MDSVAQPAIVSPSVRPATEPWLCCPSRHGQQPYSVLVEPCTRSTHVENHLVFDAAQWLCEVKCLCGKKCSRRWLACRICHFQFPGKATISGRKRKNEMHKRDETVRALLDHVSSSRHMSHMSGLPNSSSMSGSAGALNDASDAIEFVSAFDEESETPRESSLSCAITTSTSQSSTATTQILQGTIAVNSSLGQYIAKEDSQAFLGPRHIVSMACEEGARHGDAWRVSYPNPAPIFGTEFMFGYTRIFNQLPEKSRRMFVRLVDIAMETPPSERQGPLFGRARVPRSFTDANRVCLRGTHSIVNSLPLPRFHVVGTRKKQHVCVHPLDVIQYAFATLPAETLANIPIVINNAADIPTSPDSVSSYFESKDYAGEVKSTVQSLINLGITATIQLMVRWFSDAWDPNSTKDNRNGVWSMIMTVMFGPQTGLREVVFPLAVGPKAGDHSPAVDWVLKEVSKLGDFAIVRDVPNRRNVRIRVSTALIQVDRLERGELWGGLNHSSNRGKCHGVISGYDSLHHTAYAPCTPCIKHVVSSLLDCSDTTITIPTCSQCACYDPTSSLLTGPVPNHVKKCVFPFPPTTAESNSTNGLLDVVVPGNSCSPPDCRPVACRESTLPESPVETPAQYGPVEVNQVYMVVSCRFLAYHTWTGTIKTVQFVKAWAEACGVSYSVMLSIYNEACRHRELGTANFSDVFTTELLPPTWLHHSWNIDKFLNAPMHLLFLGLTQKVMDMLDEWLTYHSLKASFNSSSSAACDLVGKLRLDWLKLLRYGHSTLSRGLWVSEQYVAFSKFMLVAVSGLVGAKNPLTAEIKCVLRVVDALFVLLSYLMRRSVDKSVISGSRAAIVLYLFAIDDFGELLHVRQKSKSATSSDDGSTSNAATGATSLDDPLDGSSSRDPSGTGNGQRDSPVPAMESEGTTTTTEVPASSQEPLSSEGRSGKKYRPVSLSNPNTASLIRIILSMITHGPPCDQWDGNQGCEASIQDLKDFFHATCMVDGDSVLSSFKRYYRNRILCEIGEYLEQCGTLFNDEDRCDMERERFSHLVRYTSRQYIIDIFDGTRVVDNRNEWLGAVSGLLYENAEKQQIICVAVGRRNGEESLYQVSLSDEKKSLYDVFVNKERCTDRDFCSSFLHFANASVLPDTFHPSAAGYKYVSKVCFVSARHVWRDVSKCHELTQLDGIDGLFAVVTDDYRRMDKHGHFPETTSPSASLWKEIIDDQNEWRATNWENIIQDKTSNVAALTVAELKSILREHKLPLGGLKADLVARVQDLYETLADAPETVA